MAVRGRKPQPAALKLVKGDTEQRGISVENAPEFTAGEVEPPDYIHETVFREDFLREWERIVRQLRDWGLLSPVHQGPLEGIASHYAMAVRATKLVDTTAARQSWDAHRKAMNEFGLTLASQGRVGGSGKKAADPAEGYFGTGTTG